MEPTQATWAILGLIAQKPRSGYDLKRAIDRTIRHFWAASYGQIYPDLRRLEAAGWIAGDDAPRGGRARRIYRITPAGSAALDRWLAGAETRVELRDESLLRLFFSDTLPHDRGLGPDPPFVDLVYRWALDYCEWGVAWCDRELERLGRAA